MWPWPSVIIWHFDLPEPAAAPRGIGFLSLYQRRAGKCVPISQLACDTGSMCTQEEGIFSPWAECIIHILNCGFG